MALLGEHGADLAAKDSKGRSALQWAREEGHDAVRKLLKQKQKQFQRQPQPQLPSVHLQPATPSEVVVPGQFACSELLAQLCCAVLCLRACLR